MGIERFFSSIEASIINVKGSFTKTFDKRLNADYLYIDFNSIVYITSYKVLSDLNKILYLIIRKKSATNRSFDELVNEYNLKIDNKITAQKYSEYITSRINKIMLSKVQEYIINILTNYVDPNRLKHLYIAIDGVPSKAKMVEQKKRRYISVIAEDINKKIYEKHKKKLSDERFLYEENKITWSRNNITPGTPFMHELDKLLKDTVFHSEIQNICKNIRSFIYSGMYEYGEGEKKIVDHLRATKQEKGEYVIYSPDSDVTLLGLILNCRLGDTDRRKISRLRLLRHNQQKDSYDIVDIDALSKNIFAHVKKIVNRELDRSLVILDIVFLLSIFGNDFLPKINTYNVRDDFINIINIYGKIIQKNKKHVINIPNRLHEKRTVNFDIFLLVIEALKEREYSNSNKVYLSSNYHNYRKMKKIFNTDSDNFQPTVSDFLKQLKEFDSKITKQTKDIKIDKDFAERLKILTRLGIPYNAEPSEVIKIYADYYKDNNRLPIVGIALHRFKRSITTPFHKRNLEQLHKNTHFSTTAYDIEKYKFNNMLDEYADKLNYSPLNLGYIQIDARNYAFKSQPIKDSIKKYYREYFGINNINIKDPKMHGLLHDYIKGLLWTFEYYFNNFSIEDNRDFALTWFYPHPYAPLLTDIHTLLETLGQKDINKIISDINEQKVPMSKYFNCIEHFMYVSCAPMLLILVPSELHEFAQSSYYPDMKVIIDNIYKKDRNNIIDCRNALFMTKCELRFLHPMDTFEKDYDNFLKDIRKIDLSHDTKSRSCAYLKGKTNVTEYKFGKIVSLSEV